MHKRGRRVVFGGRDILVREFSTCDHIYIYQHWAPTTVAPACLEVICFVVVYVSSQSRRRVCVYCIPASWMFIDIIRYTIDIYELRTRRLSSAV